MYLDDRPSGKSRASRGICFIVASALLITACGVEACGGSGGDPHWRVATYRAGQAEADLRRNVGAPTHEGQAGTDGSCKKMGASTAQRELFYDIPSQGVAKRTRALFGMGPATRLVVCVDSAGKIAAVITEHIH